MGNTDITVPASPVPEMQLTEDAGKVPSSGHQEPEFLPQYRHKSGFLTTLPPRICRRLARILPFGFIFVFHACTINVGGITARHCIFSRTTGHSDE